jgi:nitrogen-specific signal transduction histidine kinase/CheY-like chemotaxis protein
MKYIEYLKDIIHEKERLLEETKKRLTKKLALEHIKHQKLESLGILAGGIAHDFNNLLTAILGNITLAKISSKSESEKLKILSEAEKSVSKAKNLAQQLLTFSKGGAPVKKIVSISKIIRESVSFALSGSNVICEFSIPDELWQAECNEGQISQVINNLIINAKESMPEGGVVEVKAENVQIKTKQILPISKGKYIKISIKDYGVGISEKHLSKIFDPYLTTKPKGSGLGLTTAYYIIKNHNGYIDVESKLGVGTTFYVYLPASDKKVLDEEKDPGKTLKGKGKILLIDDEEDIRKVTGEILKYLGYKVEFAKDGAEAINIYKRAKVSKHPFDGVILDLVVPGGMSAKETIQKLITIDPKVKPVVSSGYSDPIMADFRKYGLVVWSLSLLKLKN